MSKTLKTEEPSLAVQISALLAPHGLRLVDRADGCKGHYCIQRKIPGTNGKYVEHWNENKGGHWNSFGTVYTDARQALGQAWLILGANSEICNTLQNIPPHNGTDR